MENQRSYMDQIGTSIGASKADMTPWYNVTAGQLHRLGAASLLKHRYNNSMHAMLSKVYPEVSWEPWKFKFLPHNIGLNPDVLKACLEFVKKSLQIESLEGWYRVSSSQLSELGVSRIITVNGGLYQALKAVWPEVEWDPTRFSRSNAPKTTSNQENVTINK